MRAREQQRLRRMVANPPRVAPRWLTPEMVVAATPLDHLDIIGRSDMQLRRVLLLIAVARRGVEDLKVQLDATSPDAAPRS